MVCAVPWARHQARFTRAFEDQAAWLAVNCSKTAVAELMRIAWRTVGAICERVAAGAMREIDLLDGLRRIGIEIQLATDALDEIRREVWNEARRAGHM